ncbi:MAG: hypothetical protein OEZ01_01380, partial [Candidatus Heimdallarchaeota archaeon]|nr:hypothetical protein [Candidatus Heimdallarchaeota archaeon]
MTDNKMKYYEVENITTEEKEFILSRVYFLKENIFYHKGLQGTTIYSFNLMHDKLIEIIKNHTDIYLIVDLSDVKDKGGQVIRNHISEKFNSIEGLRYIAYMTGKNRFITSTLRFFMRRLTEIPYSIHSNMDDAYDGIEKFKAQ